MAKQRRNRAAIGVEALEGRAVLSTVHAMVLPVSGALIRGLSYMDLQGSAHGSPMTIVGNPEVGTTVKLQGAGRVSGLGPVKLSAMLHGTGFIASSRVEGPLTLSTARGRVILQLEGPASGGFQAPRSGTYSFSIQKGTGVFSHHIGNGTAALVLGPRSFTLTFQGKPNVA